MKKIKRIIKIVIQSETKAKAFENVCNYFYQENPSRCLQTTANLAGGMLESLGIPIHWERTCTSDRCACETHDAYTAIGIK